MAGQPRTFARLQHVHSAWLRELRESHEVDVFLHGWADSESRDINISRAIERIGFRAVALEAQPKLSADYLFAPTTTGGGDPGSEGRVHNFAAMWHSIQRSLDLAWATEQQHDFSYDWVIRARPDAAWDPVAEVNAALERGRTRFPRRLASQLEPSDLAFVANRADAGVLSDLYRSIPTFRSAYEAYGYRSFVPEFALGFYLRHRAISWQPFDTDLMVLREAGDRVWFRQDPISFAFHATRSIDAISGDGLPVEGLSRTDRLQVDIQYNLRCSREEAIEIARWAGIADAPTSVSQALVAVSPRGMLAPSPRNALAVGLLVERFRRVSPRRAAITLCRHPLRSLMASIVLVRIGLLRRHAETSMLLRLKRVPS